MAPIFTGSKFGFGTGVVSPGIVISAGPFTITGGSTTLTPGDGKRYHVFLGPGSLTVSPGPGSTGSIDMFIVAGGGAGGTVGPASDDYAGPAGGGAGGVVYATSYQIYAPRSSSISYPVVVGPGGTASADNAGGNGNPSSIDLSVLTGAPSTAAITLTAVGGGGGANWSSPPNVGRAGGNGGGGTSTQIGGSLTAPPNSPVYPQAPGTVTVYGNAGHQTTSIYGAGGGGSGAGGVGEPPSADGTNFGGDGGAGRAFPAYPGPLIAPATPNPAVFGPVVGPTGLYAGGGGGACYRNNYAPDGDAGPGGGGYGGTGRGASGTPLGRDAVPATGGGGGGGAGKPSGVGGGSGGQGIVIVSYTIS